MFRGENIICLSSIDWDFIWQGHQEIMSTLARGGNRVLFIENTGARSAGLKDLGRMRRRFINWRKGVSGIRKVKEDLYILSPLIFPFPHSPIFRYINKHILLSVLKRWVKSMDFADVIFWTYLPTGLSSDIIDNLDHKLSVYCCIDNLSLSSRGARKIKRPEAQLIKKADLVFVSGKKLYEHCRQYRDKDVYIFREGVNIDNFKRIGRECRSSPLDFKDIPRPIIGYIGGIHKWIDQKLIAYLASQHPKKSFVFIGPLQTDVSFLKKIKNIYFLGQKNGEEIPLYIKEFKIGTIPYVISDYTSNVYPTKLNEYLALGIPVISTNLPEVMGFNQEYNNIVKISFSREEFSESIEKLLAEENFEKSQERLAVAQGNSWAMGIEKMSQKMAETIKLKKIEADTHWSNNLIKFYRKGRKKVVTSFIYLIIFYLITFYTPFIWFLAKPLRISDFPKNADAIVVLAGGVGESGQPGQGYEERVQHAVELYKQGYAKYMIFSSGYTYAFKEPMIMEALAVSQGIPEKAIILEDKAKNTYENIMFTKEILIGKNWDKVLLISSPYHMRRVSLVAKKVANGIAIIYTPIPESRFYRHSIGPKGEMVWKQIDLRQIRGLLHEYLGILYYWWKGYI